MGTYCSLCGGEKDSNRWFGSEYCERCGDFLFSTIWAKYLEGTKGKKSIFEYLLERPWLLFLR